MIALNLRLRRSFIIIWCLALWAFLAVFPPAYENYYPTAEDREAFVLGMQRNAGMTAMWGPVESPATLGQIVMWEAGSMMIILGSVMAVLLIVGLHRRSETLGLTELQLSTGINRMAPAATAVLTTAIVAAIVGAGSTAVLALSGLYVEEMPVEGAVSSGAVIALTMLGSALLAQLVLLLVSDPAALTRTGLMTIAGSFVVRSVADSEDIGWLNWVSPLGWKTVVHPYVNDDWMAFGKIAIIGILAAGVVFIAERWREYGSALVAVPSLTPRRTRDIRGPLHLSAVLSRSTILTWTIVIAGLTGFFIALTGSLSEWMEAEANIGRIFEDIFGDGDMKTEFIGYILKLTGILIATMGVQIVVTYRSGEVDRTVDLQRSTSVRRWIPLGAASILSVAGLVLATVGALGGGALGLWTQDSTISGDYDTLIPSTWSQLAPALLLTAISVALVGLMPRFTHLSWAPVVGAAVLTLFGPVLSAPQWLIDLSPFEYVVTPNGGSWTPHLFMGATALVLIGLGWWGSQRREIR
ncbi:MAG: hypothetical protein Q4G50_10165 [Corynebacterium sp.]|uniref:hypothetical protein n=1 Tax=Corynebacterium sp. TaxID=1720 RepID=UPI0026DF372B|nr:hypothetical protein [Corynebacterium sp.]MDO5670359.1 hypothetical protein [Corynebacterium sp.]